MQENLGITLIKVGLLALIALFLMMNTCQMSGWEDRFMQLNEPLEKIEQRINKLEKTISELSESGINVSQTAKKSDVVQKKINTLYHDPYSHQSLVDFCYYNPEDMKKAILKLQETAPDAAAKITELPKQRADFDNLLLINLHFC